MKKISCTFYTLFHTILVTVVLTFGLTIFSTSQSYADLRLCNQTESRISVAIGYKGEEGWRSEGWWNFDPDNDDDACKILLLGPLKSRFYYIYAIDITSGGEWGGEARLCTRQKEFIINGNNECIVRGYEQTGFFEVDTGKQKSWTIRLTDPDKNGQ